MFNRILIANRGEIAVRVIRAAREMGIETVAVFSTADRESQHVSLADRAICIGGPAASESYLNIPHIISAAEVASVDAIHPGYGFLAENAHFAEVCRSCNIEFIGPSEQAMRTLGDKVRCRELAKANNVPTAPGSKGQLESEEDAVRIAREIGYPVMIKAAAGGGGRGMRLAHNDIALRSAVNSAMAEAETAFGDATIYIEKFIEHARHVEVQILGDRHGKVVHLFERDCTLQRRHQKLIEESPCPVLNDERREAICSAAVRLAEAAGYDSVGTVEFLMDPRGEFHLMEVNTRLQVEHPVTELVTGVDLVKAQIRVAAGEALWLSQGDIQLQGAAIEARINAEDPSRNFMPSPGPVHLLRWPGGPGVRVDTHTHAGAVVPPHYDSMIGKVIAFQPTREAAITTMLRALGELQIEPTKTTAPLLIDLLRDGRFRDAAVDIHFVERLLGK